MIKGGSSIPAYRQEINVDANDPNVPIDTKKHIDAYNTKTRPPTQNAPLLTLQLNNPQPPKRSPIQNVLPLLPNMFDMTNYKSGIMPFGGTPQMNVVNNVVVGDQNPYQPHGAFNYIYEDMLPTKDLPKNLSTINERTTLSQFIKSVILYGKDGENIPFRNGQKAGTDITTNNRTSLIDRLKTTELNPYHCAVTSMKDNPYKTLPKNMLIFRSCYPIQRTKGADANHISCARGSVGMNLRLYRMTQGEMMVNRVSGDELRKSDVWREIMYYEYVRENIIKTKECPNFVMMIGYSLCKDSDIDFDKLEQIKNHAAILPKKQPLVIKINNNMVKNPNAYANDLLIGITESPTYSFAQWASNSYTNIGLTKKMIRNGYHPSNVWKSIIFQIMVAMHALQKHNIYINGMNILDNVYIKELSDVSITNSHWQYVIDGINYYIPNYGYLVMIDSKFKDVDVTGITLGAQKQKQFKIYGDMFGDQKVAINNSNIDAFLNIINPNIFATNFTENGGIRPPDDIISLLTSINNYTISHRGNQGFKISECIYEFMKNFLHNRTGTLLTEPELKNMGQVGRKFNTGEIVVYNDNPDVYKFAIFGSYDGQGNCNICTKNNPDDDEIIETYGVPRGNLRDYSKTSQLKQIYKPNEQKITEMELLETYNL